MLTMITLKWNKPIKPTIEMVRKELGLSMVSIDEDYGIVEIDHQQHLYTVLGDDTILKSSQHNSNNCVIISHDAPI